MMKPGQCQFPRLIEGFTLSAILFLPESIGNTVRVNRFKDRVMERVTPYLAVAIVDFLQSDTLESVRQRTGCIEQAES